MQYEKLYNFVLSELESRLPKNLYYHGLHHTLDVLREAERIGQSEQISEEGALLLRVGAILHDSGFIKVYFKNEPIGAEIAREWLPEYGFSERQIEIVERMILATALPQNPQSHLDQILCDADLDYLGRQDFYPIAHSLKLEWSEYGLIKNLREWYELQVNFLKAHQYFTKTQKNHRQATKQAYIDEISHMLGMEQIVEK